jgi:hypothetical protein
MASVEPAPLPPPPPRITSKKASEKKDPSYAACHKPYVPTAHDANIVGDVTRMAKMCETATGLKKLVAKKDGKQQDQSAPQDLAFRAEKGKCYRVYAQAESTIEDLDLALVDSEKNIAGEDTTDDSSPVVGEDSVICFSEADSALVRISVGRGGGRWAVQIWGN